jgi:hypothetical protein
MANTFVMQKLATILVGTGKCEPSHLVALPTVVTVCARKAGLSEWNFIMQARQNPDLAAYVGELCTNAFRHADWFDIETNTITG